MKKEFVITDILHSGRKGERYTPVQNNKYDGVIGYTAKIDTDSIERGKSLFMKLPDSPIYEWWNTSMVLAVWENKDDNILTIETENTIYILKECNDD